ncbi:CD83 antigen-like [Heterodontus francisci]|uniref:CD83 antigen-like n=1 Tax=Heterodontus francisci TaxID=7792 RepID=UPI00355C1617
MFHHVQHPGSLLVLQSLLFVGVVSTRKVVVKCGEAAMLPCQAEPTLGIQYRAISWYKVDDDGVGLTGIVRKDFQENITRKYLGFNGSVELASARPYFLTIHNVSNEDFGTYQCSLWAPLGERNKQADVGLREEGIFQPLKFGGQLTILPIVLTILGSALLIYMVFVSITCARNHKVPLDCKKFNNA